MGQPFRQLSLVPKIPKQTHLLTFLFFFSVGGWSGKTVNVALTGASAAAATAADVAGAYAAAKEATAAAHVAQQRVQAAREQVLVKSTKLPTMQFFNWSVLRSRSV